MTTFRNIRMDRLCDSPPTSQMLSSITSMLEACFANASRTHSKLTNLTREDIPLDPKLTNSNPILIFELFDVVTTK